MPRKPNGNQGFFWCPPPGHLLYSVSNHGQNWRGQNLRRPQNFLCIVRFGQHVHAIYIYVYFHAISMLFPLPRNQFFQLIQSHQPGRLGIMAHELQPVMPTAVPGLRYRWPRVALPWKLWRQVFQTVSERAGRCASREKMDESQGCHQPDEKCAGLRSSAFFFLPTKNQQQWANFWHNFLRSCWFEIHTCSLRPWGLRPTTCWSVLKQSAHRTLASCIFWSWKS